MHNFHTIHNLATSILHAMSSTPPASFKDIPGEIDRHLDACAIPFAERRFVCMVMAQMAGANSLGVSAKDAKKLLVKIEGYALKAHDRWSNAGFFICGGT